MARQASLAPGTNFPLNGWRPSINPSNDGTKKSEAPAFLAPLWAISFPNNSTDFIPLIVAVASKDSIPTMSGVVLPSMTSQ